MGNKQIVAGITEDQLNEYVCLTYLSKAEIVHLLKQFYSIGKAEMDYDYNYRFHKSYVMEKFSSLKFNPFREEIFSTFSSHQDNCMSFEDMLDLCSVMSEDCPESVKAMWAFRIFDLDNDNQITVRDLCEIIDRLTYTNKDTSNFIQQTDKVKIARIILKEMDLQGIGSFGPAEFMHLISKMPEFKKSFYFKV